MGRKLILTPYEHGFLAALDHFYNKGSFADKDNEIDIPHVLLSALTMSGVDSILSIGSLTNSNTNLLKKITSKASIKNWSEVYQKSEKIVNTYKANIKEEKTKEDLDEIKHKISQLLFSLKTNSGIITFTSFTDIKNRERLPLDLAAPFEILMSSLQTKSANLPVIKFEIDKKEVKRFISILESKEFSNYKEAQSEIEQNQTLTNKTIRTIELAGRDLYRKNISHLNIKENALKAIPLTGKVVELFFGKLPGILTDYSTTIVGDYLKLNKSIPIYNCEPLLEQIKMASLRTKVLRFKSKKDELSQTK